MYYVCIQCYLIYHALHICGKLKSDHMHAQSSKHILLFYSSTRSAPPTNNKIPVDIDNPQNTVILPDRTPAPANDETNHHDLYNRQIVRTTLQYGNLI